MPKTVEICDLDPPESDEIIKSKQNQTKMLQTISKSVTFQKTIILICIQGNDMKSYKGFSSFGSVQNDVTKRREGKNFGLKSILLGGIASVGFLLPCQTFAQDAAPKSEEMVVITGSRIKANGYDKPTPVTVTTAEALQAAAPMTIADGIFQLPQNIGSTSRTFCCAVGSLGNFLNLRGLGATRTLILLDGQRVVPTRESGEIDVNLLPEALVSRVDIVTGGASAAYGSDAVSGVVNYVVAKKYDGQTITAQYGQSNYSDDASIKLSYATGGSFGDENTNWVFSAEHFKVDGIRSLLDRPDSARSAFLSGNGSAAAPFVTIENARSILGTEGGLIISNAFIPVANATNPLAGLMFTGPNTTKSFVFGTPVNGSGSANIGGDGISYNKMQPAGLLSTDKIFGKLSHKFSDNLSAYARIMASQSHNAMRILSDNRAATLAYTIFRDNAYLPAHIASAMDAAGVTSFKMARFNTDFDTINLDYDNKSYDFSVGLEGRLNQKTSWSVNYSHGETDLHAEVQNVANLSRVYTVADAVLDPSTNQIVCRVQLTNPGLYPGCVPMNLFGSGSPSRASLNYVLGNSLQDVLNTQDVLSFEMQSELFTLPAGTTDFAWGLEYRRRTLKETSNAVALSQIQATGVRGMPTALCPTVALCRFGAWHQGNFGEADASDDVKEAFIEIQSPLLANAPLAKKLDLNAAYRYTNYKNSGSVSTWKIGITYEPFDELRIRATKSRDIRAPNLFELFAGPVNAFAPGLTDPVSGLTNVIAITRTQGNPNLNPEKADTLSYGVVYRPKWFKGFAGSIDYYEIEVGGALASTTAQGTIDGCVGGNQALCALITRDTSNNITQIILQQINLNGREIRGIDYDFSYNTKIADGDFTARAVFTNTLDYIDKIGTSRIQSAGWFNTANNLALPKWRGNFSINYKKNSYSFYLQERYIGDYMQMPPIAGQIFLIPKIEPIFYTDVTIKKELSFNNNSMELYGTINNLLNQRPPFVGNRFVPGLAFPTVPGLYDLDNRYYTVGIKYRF